MLHLGIKMRPELGYMAGYPWDKHSRQTRDATFLRGHLYDLSITSHQRGVYAQLIM